MSRASAHAGQKHELCLSAHGHLPGETIIVVVIILVTVNQECDKYLSCSCVQALQILYAYHPKDPAFTTETCVELLSCDSASSDCLADDPVDIATTQCSAALWPFCSSQWQEYRHSRRGGSPRLFHRVITINLYCSSRLRDRTGQCACALIWLGCHAMPWLRIACAWVIREL